MAIAEGMTLGVKAGVEPEALLDALQRSSFGQGRVLREMIPNTVFPGAFDKANFALRLLRKDVGLATELGREYHVPMMIAALAEQQLEEALGRGWGDKDSNALFCLQEERAGVQLRTKRG
jgi:3-hydroxyisobutyrate dehydrogenase